MPVEQNICPYCQGPLLERREKNHKVSIAGHTVVMEEAVVGRCRKCGRAAYALRPEVAALRETKGNDNETK